MHDADRELHKIHPTRRRALPPFLIWQPTIADEVVNTTAFVRCISREVAPGRKSRRALHVPAGTDWGRRFVYGQAHV